VATSDGLLVANDRSGPAPPGASPPRSGPGGQAARIPASAPSVNASPPRIATPAQLSNQRLHQLSRRLVDDHDLIVHEKLQVLNLVRRPHPPTRPAPRP